MQIHYYFLHNAINKQTKQTFRQTNTAKNIILLAETKNAHERTSEEFSCKKA